MSRIFILDNRTVNQIAAGEIVEKPASVVKELVENAIDAHSSAVTVEIKGGGISYIRVTDNGDGMDQVDAKLSFQRHATSKIKGSADLKKVATLGFRGEALASIAAVSQVEMITRTANSSAGVQIINHGGRIIAHKEMGCPEGTTIIIRNLFYNTPARLKFLKSARAETASISELVGKLILANPGISFKYINQNNIVYQSPGDNNILSAILSVYGTNVLNDIIEINGSKNGISIWGYLGKPSLSRTNRNHQSFFVNGRYIKSAVLSECLEKAYRSFLTINRFPWAVLHFVMPPSLTDVNVHPAKTEIRFRDEKAVWETLHELAEKALNDNPHIPIFNDSDFNPKYSTGNTETEDVDKKPSGEQLGILPDFDMGSSANTVYNTGMPADESRLVNIGESATAVFQSCSHKKNTDKGGIKGGIYDHTITNMSLMPYKVVGRVFSTYVIVEDESQVFFIDQHAAHERLLFEEYKRMLSSQKIVSQQLLPPVVLEVTHGESLILQNSIGFFHSLGFDIEPFGNRTFAIRGVPSLFVTANIKEVFNSLLDRAQGYSPHNYAFDMEDVMKMACKNAVKANDPLSDSEIVALLDALLKEKLPLTCPHGRPIITSITRYELEKKFKRVQ